MLKTDILSWLNVCVRQRTPRCLPYPRLLHLAAGAILWALVGPVPAEAQFWAVPGGGSWDTSTTNWDTTPYPNAPTILFASGAGASASFFNLPGPLAINTTGSIVLGRLNLDSTANITFTSLLTPAWTFDNGGLAQIKITDTYGSPTYSINNDFILKNNLEVNMLTSGIAGHLIVNGLISEATVGMGITFTGVGATEISNLNTFSGAVVINKGSIVAVHSNNQGFGTPSKGNVINDGGALYFWDNGAGPVTITETDLTINGAGPAGSPYYFGAASQGAIVNYAGTNRYNGQLIVNSNSLITSLDHTTLDLNGSVSLNHATLGINTEVISSTSQITVNGAISGTGGSSGIAITKDGAGTAIFTGGTSNTYTGNTVVNRGTLLLQKTAGGIDAIPTSTTVIVNTSGTLLLGNTEQIHQDGAQWRHLQHRLLDGLHRDPRYADPEQQLDPQPRHRLAPSHLRG
jgi:autotransporter-associated beta strand protein